MRQPRVSMTREAHAALLRDQARLDWLERHAAYELHIEADEDGAVTVRRWWRRYVTSHDWTGESVRDALDNAIAATKP